MLPKSKQQVSNASMTAMQQPPPHPKQPLPPVPSIQVSQLIQMHNQGREYYLDVAEPDQYNPYNLNHHHQSRSPLSSPEVHMQPAQVQPISFDQMTEYDEEDYAVPADESSHRLDRTQVELVQLIGEGQRGYVFLGKLQSKDGRQIHDVAIKTLKYETPQLIEWLMREATMMRQLEHPHIIRFIGVCPESPALIAMELAQMGELKHYLKQNQPMIPRSQLVLYTFQISTALSYLEGRQLVHRDVAARNVLVCGQNCVKLADFGLTRTLQAASVEYEPENNPVLLGGAGGHYVAAARGKLPVRWLAPESLAFRRFTSASDVWMFAVCSWEMFHYGQLRPWAHIRNNQVLMAIESGERLLRPPHCPGLLYELLLRCWSYAPIQRPKFRELKQNLWSIYLGEKAKEQQQQQQIILQQQHQQQQHQLVLQQQARARHLAHSNRMKQHKLATLDDRLTTPRISARLRPQPDVLGVSSPLNVSYGSNVSGYSSATAADFSSHNSSRSSSMGSLARRQQQRQHQHQAVPDRVWQQPQPQQPVAKLPIAARPASRGDMKFDSSVEQNMKRFQRASGHMLQKQRSQGSIVQPTAYSSNPSIGLRHKNLSGLGYGSGFGFGYDDGALLAGSAARMRHHLGDRPLSQLQFGAASGASEEEEEEEEDNSQSDAEGDYDEDPSSDEQLAAASDARRALSRQQQRLPINAVKRDEPTYEGLMAACGRQSACGGPAEVAMIRGDLSVIQPARRRLRGSPKTSGPSESMKREEKLSDVLQSLRLSPMKARLSGHPSGPSGPSEAANSRPTVGQRPSPDPKSPPACEPHKEPPRDLQQLALHQRLLGHIRPAPASASRSSEHRRSMNMEQQQQQQQAQNRLAPNSANRDQQQQQQQDGGSSVEKVDQSLQILESLIGDKSFSPNQPQPQQQQHSLAADDLVNQHRQHMKQQLQQPDKTRTNAAQQFVDFFVRRKQQPQQQ